MADKPAYTADQVNTLLTMQQHIGTLQRDLGKVEGTIPQMNARIDSLKDDLKEGNKRLEEEIKQLKQENQRHNKRLTVLENFKRTMLILVSMTSAAIAGIIAYWESLVGLIKWLVGIR